MLHCWEGHKRVLYLHPLLADEVDESIIYVQENPRLPGVQHAWAAILPPKDQELAQCRLQSLKTASVQCNDGIAPQTEASSSVLDAAEEPPNLAPD